MKKQYLVASTYPFHSDPDWEWMVDTTKGRRPFLMTLELAKKMRKSHADFGRRVRIYKAVQVGREVIGKRKA